LHTVKPLAECQSSCAANPTCKAISVGTYQGTSNMCIECTVATTAKAAKAFELTTYVKTAPVPHQAAETHYLADGGIMENTGLLQMLQRGASRIVMFVANNHPLDRTFDFCSASLASDFVKANVSGDILGLFGFWPVTLDSKGGFYSDNQVFKQEQMLDLLCSMKKLLDSGKAAVVRDTYTVVPNTWWGIKGGYTAEVVILYNERVTEFESLLPPSTKAALPQSQPKGPFQNYPFYLTTCQQGYGIPGVGPVGGLNICDNHFTDYTASQVNLLAATSEYAVLQNAQLIRDTLSLR